MSRTRILIADDHEMVVQAFRILLATSYEIIDTVTDGQSLVKAAHDLSPDIILVDLSMPQLNGLDAIERIKAERPRIRLIVLTQEEDADTAAEAIRRGATGFVLKSSAPTELFEAIEEVLRGRVYVSPKVARTPSAVFAATAIRAAHSRVLTLRQREVLQLLAEGKSMKEAGHILNVSPRTIAFHKYTMMEQLGLKTGAELVHHAVTLGLVSRRLNS